MVVDHHLAGFGLYRDGVRTRCDAGSVCRISSVAGVDVVRATGKQIPGVARCAAAQGEGLDRLLSLQRARSEDGNIASRRGASARGGLCSDGEFKKRTVRGAVRRSAALRRTT